MNLTSPSAELSEAPVPLPSAATVPSRGEDPLDKVVLRSQSVLIIGCVAAVGWTLAVIGPFVAFYLARPDFGLAVVDPAGNWSFSRLRDFWSSQDVYRHAVGNVAIALLSRNPNGPDEPLLFKTVFTDDGRKKAKKLLEETASLFRDNKIFQSVKVGRTQLVNLPEQDGKKITKAVTNVQILQNGIMNGQEFTEPFTLKLTIILVRNDDFLSNGLFPLVAHDFEMERLP